MADPEKTVERQARIRSAAQATFDNLNEERAKIGITARHPLDWESFYTGYLNGAADVNEGLL